jgi:hypothetical protein
MVGHASRARRYRYYHCATTTGDHLRPRCPKVEYIPCELLERRVRESIADALGQVDRLLAEARHANQREADSAELAEIADELAKVEAQQARLARAYTSGVLPEDVLAAEGSRLKEQRQRLERERRALEASRVPAIDLDALERGLPATAARLREWVLTAPDEDLELMLRGLQVQVAASRARAEVAGVLPPLLGGPESFATFVPSS